MEAYTSERTIRNQMLSLTRAAAGGGKSRPFLGAPRQDTDLLGATVSRALRHGATQVAMATSVLLFFDLANFRAV